MRTPAGGCFDGRIHTLSERAPAVMNKIQPAEQSSENYLQRVRTWGNLKRLLDKIKMWSHCGERRRHNNPLREQRLLRYVHDDTPSNLTVLVCGVHSYASYSIHRTDLLLFLLSVQNHFVNFQYVRAGEHFRRGTVTMRNAKRFTLGPVPEGLFTFPIGLDQIVPLLS